MKKQGCLWMSYIWSLIHYDLRRKEVKSRKYFMMDCQWLRVNDAGAAKVITRVDNVEWSLHTRTNDTG